MTTEYYNGAKYYLTRYFFLKRVIIMTIDIPFFPISHAVKI